LNNNGSKKFLGGRVAQSIIRGVLVAFAALAVAGIASAQDKQDKKDEITFDLLPNLTTSSTITPEAGNVLFLTTRGVGTQGYVCLPKDGGASWTVNNARPEATLFAKIFGEPVQIITHFLSPIVNPNDIGPKPPRFGDVTWQSSFDSSRVWAQKQKSITAGTDASCPNGGAIDCLLLQVISVVAEHSGCARGVAPVLVLFACAPVSQSHLLPSLIGPGGDALTPDKP